MTTAVAKLTTHFGPNDRRGALLHALRFARSEFRTYVLYFDYDKDEWTVSPYEEWALISRLVTLPMEDLRFVLPQGEVTRMG